MSDWSRCHPATWYAAFPFLFSLPSVLQLLLSLKMCPIHRFFLSNIAIKSFLFFFTMSYTYSLISWSFQLMFSIFHLIHISKASNLSLSYFPSVHVSDLYNALNDSLYNFLLQIFAHSFWNEFSSFECSLGHFIIFLLFISAVQVPSSDMSYPKMVHLLYYLSIYRYVDHVVSFSFTPVSVDSHHFGLLDIYLHAIQISRGYMQ